MRSSPSSPLLWVCLALGACTYISEERYQQQLDKDGDGVLVSVDCDDNDPTVGDTYRYRDADEDGFGAGTPELRCADDAGWSMVGTDCDDLSASVNPDAAEVCNTVDDNCDGSIDGDDAIDQLAWFPDLDGDGFGDPGVDPIYACAAPSQYNVSNAADCDDDDAGVGALSTWYLDNDGDGYGNRDVAISACPDDDGTGPDGYAAQQNTLALDDNDGFDCNDDDPQINPGAKEVCDAGDVDENCNDLVDDEDPDFDPEGTRALWFADRDGDGFGTTGETARSCDPPEAVAHTFDGDEHEAHAWILDSRDCEDDPDEPQGYDLSAPTDCEIEQLAVGVDAGCWREANGYVECTGDNDPIVNLVPDVSFVTIDVGEEHACGITVYGRLQCWGGGPAAPSGILHDVSTVANDLSVQLNHTCIVTPAGVIRCWAEGITYEPEHGLGDEVVYLTVSAGSGHGCGIVGEEEGSVPGAVDCFGGGCSFLGECEDLDDEFIRIGAGYAYTCGLISDDGDPEVGTLECWGEPPPGWRGLTGVYEDLAAGPLGLCVTDDDGFVECLTFDPLGDLTPPAGIEFESIDVGVEFACGIFDDNEYICWGEGFLESSDPDWDGWGGGGGPGGGGPGGGGPGGGGPDSGFSDSGFSDSGRFDSGEQDSGEHDTAR